MGLSRPRPAYQLTEHPVGSLAEIWAVSWPLMLSFCSGSLMMFADRLYLAHYNMEAMNAMAVAGLAGFCFLVFPFGIAQISEVFVGRFHGEENHAMIGRPAWQIVWLALFTWPIMSLLSRLLGGVIFAKGSLEEAYFVQMLDFTPFFLMSVGFMGFYIGIGKTHVITYVTIIGNLANIILAPAFIFGSALSAPMGVTGAALATGISQGIQVCLLLAIYLHKTRRKEYRTYQWRPSFSLISQMLKVAVPSGLGRFIEVIAICVFFRIMASSGHEALTAATMAQSFYLLLIFCIDGITKGVTSVISNLVGAKEYGLIPKAIIAGLKVHAIVFVITSVFCLVGCEAIYSWILHEGDVALLQNEQFRLSLKITLIWNCLFFLLDGFSWITSGHLTSLGDTKYIMYVTACIPWLTYVLPLYFLVHYYSIGAAGGYALLVLDGFAMFSLFWWRSQRHIALRGDSNLKTA